MAQDMAIEAWVDRFVNDRDNQYVSEQCVERAADMLRRIGKEACARGFDIPSPNDEELLRAHHDNVAWAHIVIALEDAIYFLRVQELCTPNAPRKDSSAVGRGDASVPRWMADRVREFIGTGSLQVSIRSEGDLACRKSAKDTMTSSLEVKIPSVLDEFVTALKRRRRDREERAEWEAAKELARQRFDSDCLMAVVDRQAEQYLAMQKRREYLTALECSMASYEGEDRDDVSRRIAILRERVDAEDPGLHPERIDLTVPEPTKAQLEPYMGGWSCEGPYHVSGCTLRDRAGRAGSVWSAEADVYGDDQYGTTSGYTGAYGIGSGRYGGPAF